MALDIAAHFGQQRFQDLRAAGSGAGDAPGLAVRALKVSSRKFTPMPSVPPTSASVAGVHGFPLTISANNARRTETTLPSWARPEATARQTAAGLGQVADPIRELAVRLAKCGKHFFGVVDVEQIDGGKVVALQDAGFPSDFMKRAAAMAKSSRTMTTACMRSAIALTQRIDKFRIRLAAMGVQPLFELVEHHDHLLALAATQQAECLDQSQIGLATRAVVYAARAGYVFRCLRAWLRHRRQPRSGSTAAAADRL